MQLTVSKEDYLKAIAESEAEGESVISATLVRRLTVTPAAVAMAVKRLQRDGLLQVGRQGQLSLTDEGQKVADRVWQRHHLIERMLSEMFGMEWYKVHEEAERLEHAVSDDFERKLIERLGPDGPCPHGNRVGRDTPADRRSRGWRTLDQLAAGERGTVASVYERDRRLLEHFDRLGLRPGAHLELVEKNSDDTLTLQVEGRAVPLGLSAGSKIWVASLG